MAFQLQIVDTGSRHKGTVDGKHTALFLDTKEYPKMPPFKNIPSF